MTYPSISHSQYTKACGLALKFHREFAPRGPKGIAPIQGTAWHAGVEHHMVHADPDAAVRAAHEALDEEVALAGGVERVQWDEPARLTRPNRDWPLGRPYSGDTGRMPDLQTARVVTDLMVRGWCSVFSAMRVTPFAYCPRCGAYPEGDELRCKACREVRRGRVDAASLLGVERKQRFPLDRYGMPGWKFTFVTDLEPDEGGLVDLKASKEPWDTVRAPDGTLRLDPNGRHWAKAEQGWLYSLGLEDLGEAPEWVLFHNAPRSGVVCEVEEGPGGPVTRPVSYDASAIQVVSLEYDRAQAEQVLELKVLPVVRAIDSDIWIPNTSGPFPCSRKYCDYYETVCPLGAAARGGTGAAPAEQELGAA